MKRLISWLLVVTLLLMLAMPVAMAADERMSGAFTYRLKGNGTAAITGYDWASMKEQDIYIPRMLDGYTVTEISDEAFAKISYDANGVPLLTHKNSMGFSSNTETKAGALVIPDTVTTIGAKAFFGICFTASRITIPASVQYIGPGAFSYLPNIEQFVVADGNNTFATIDGALYNKAQKELIAYPLRFYMMPVEEKETITIPEGIKSIGDYAFFGWEKPCKKTCWLPSSLESIGKYAFAYATVFTRYLYEETSSSFAESDWIFPEKMSFLGEGAFYQNQNMWGYPKGTIDLSRTQIREISKFTFYRAGWAETIRLPRTLTKVCESGLDSIIGEIESFPTTLKVLERRALANIQNDSVVLAEGVETIGEEAFADAWSLSSLTLPTTVRSIGDDLCDRTKVTIIAPADSYAAMWAYENGYMTPTSTEDTSWLNN